MTNDQEDQKFEQVVQKVAPQSKLLRAWPLKGGVSAQVTVLELQQPDGPSQKMIVRRHGERDRQRNSQIAADEFKLLQILQAIGLAAPRPYYVDQSGEIFPTPYIVIEYIAGTTEFADTQRADCIRSLAAYLAKLHQVDGSKLDLAFLPQLTNGFGERPAKLDVALDEDRIRTALEASWPLPQQNQAALLHGDFWPGNVLWRNGQLVAVIDWEDAQVGDPLADLGNSRLEILWAFGIDAMHGFTQHYQTMNPIDFTNLPYWDLCAALRPASKMSEWGLDPTVEKAMRTGHSWFITQAFEKLAETTRKSSETVNQ